MEIRTGSTRFVVTLPMLSICIKFPRVRPIAVMKHLLYEARHAKSIKDFVETILQWERAYHSCANWTIMGFIENVREWIFTLQHGNTFIAPTYFSCGFFSIMPLVCMTRLEEFNGKRIRQMFFSVVPINELSEDAHHWGSYRNFGLFKGRFVIVDYGSKKTRHLLKQYAQKLHALNLADVYNNKEVT